MLRRRLFAYTCAMIAGIASGYFILEKGKLFCGTMLMISIAVSVCFVVPDGPGEEQRTDRRIRASGSGLQRDSLLLVIWLLTGFLLFTGAYLSFESPLQLPDGTVIDPNDTAAVEGITSVSGRVLSCCHKDDIYRIVIAETGIKGVKRLQINIDASALDPDIDRDQPELSNSADMSAEELCRLIGRRVNAYGKLREIRCRDNPACFDYRLYMRSRGIRYTFRADSIVSDQASGSDSGYAETAGSDGCYEACSDDGCAKSFWNYRRFIIRKRESFLALFEDEEIRGFVRGMVFGDKSEIDEDTIETFNINSTGHILAVSGLHIGFLYALLRFLSGRKRTKLMAVLTIILIILYGEMTLWNASTVRAVTVLSIDLLAVHFRRRADMLTSVSAAAMLILIFQPYQLFNTGFQMTFIVLAAICFIAEPLKLYVGEGFAVMLAVQAGIAPLTAFVFNRFNPLALLINIPVIMTASVLIPACILMMAVNMLLGALPGFSIDLISLSVGALIHLNEVLSFDGDYSFLSAGMPGAGVIGGAVNSAINGSAAAITILFYIFIFLMTSEWMRVLLIRKDKSTIRRIFACMLLPAVMLCTLTYNIFADDEIVFVSVGQGDCTHIRCGSCDVLIDGGGSAFYNAGERTLMPYLLKNGAENVDLACVTHLHTDHYLGISQLASEGQYRVSAVGIPADYKDAMEKERTKLRSDSGSGSEPDRVSDPDSGTGERECGLNIPENIRYIEPGSRIKLDRDVYIKAIWPAAGMHRAIAVDDPNENNMVYMIHYKGVRIMVTGDLLEEDELAMVDYYKRRGVNALKCDVLKVAHHGSRSSSCEAFLDAADPSIAVIQAGENNIYGHPHQQTLDGLEARGISVCRTDTDGAVGIDIRGKGKGKKLTVDRVREPLPQSYRE